MSQPPSTPSETVASSTPPARPDQPALDRALASGIAWTGLARWGAQLLSWAATILIARLLTKGDYGLLSMANLYVGFVQLVNEFGVGAAIVRHRNLSDDEISALGGVSLAVGFGFWALSLLLAYPIALFFGEPAVQWIVMALGVNFVTTGLRTVPRGLLTRDLKFRAVAAIDASEAVISSIVTLVLAYLGWSYWSLVLGAISGSVGAAAVARTVRNHPIRWPRDMAPLRQHLTFGGHVVGARLGWYAYSNADFAVVGRVLGKEPLGAYGFGWTLATIPVARITGLLGQVTPGIFSAVQHDRPGLRRYLLLLTEGVAFFAFPVAAGLALVAHDLITVALKPEWEAAVLPLQVLSLYGAIRAITSLLPFLLQAVGRSREAMRFNLIALLVLPPLFVAGTHWGVGGVACAWVVGYPFVAIPLLRHALREADCPLSAYLHSISHALLATALMSAAVIAWQAFAPLAPGTLLRLVSSAVVGALTYALVTVVAYRDRLRAGLAVLRAAPKARRAGA